MSLHEDVSLHEVEMHLNASAIRLQQIKEATAKDPEFNSLKLSLCKVGQRKDQTVEVIYMHIGTIVMNTVFLMVSY